VVSSDYFMEDEGEIKIWPGLEKFDKPVSIDIKSMRPRVDSPAFSLHAWVQQSSKSNGVPCVGVCAHICVCGCVLSSMSCSYSVHVYEIRRAARQVWILRKPLGSEGAERELSCWGWHVLGEQQRLVFGSHDFGDSSGRFEELVSNGSFSSTTSMNHLALVVNQVCVCACVCARARA